MFDDAINVSRKNSTIVYPQPPIYTEKRATATKAPVNNLHLSTQT